MKNIALALLFFSFIFSRSIFSQSHDKIDGKFHHLRTILDQEQSVAPNEPISASIRFVIPPSDKELEHLRERGIRFQYIDGILAHSATVFPVELTFKHLDDLAREANIDFVQCSWRPHHIPPLSVSRPQIQSEEVWQLLDNQQRKVTGKGVLVADFDTGVDFFHPMMWFADGDTLAWIDVNKDTIFTTGIDAVDLNRNAKADTNEVLRYVEMGMRSLGNDSATYDSDMDWLFNDANKDGVRNRGKASGFTETAPTYGEQWFISLDANGNDKLSIGEKLVGLKTSKVRAIRTSDGKIYRRGADLIDAPPDNGPYGGHGTAVCGILNGGIVNRKKLTGIAPDAEVIVAQIPYNSTPRFYTDLPTHLAWAKQEGATVFLYEDGEWVWEFLDGSSNEEIMMNEYSRDYNIVHVAPAGNLTGGGMMKTITIPKSDTLSISLTVPPRLTYVWHTFLFKGAKNDITIRAEAPSKNRVLIPFDDSRMQIDSTQLFSNTTLSSRNTVRAIVEMHPVDSGRWTFHFTNTTAYPKQVYCFVGDNYFSWSGAARWIQPTEDNTVTWPATADSAIGIAAYNPRDKMNINGFSGRGKRLDGFMPVDVACPGSTVYSIGRNNSYTAFGGTSSAGPHGAGAVALVLQKYPGLKFSEVERFIRAGALKDSLTGSVPNSTWGWGKLRIFNSLAALSSIEAFARPQAISLDQNFPNPFSDQTTIRFRVQESNSEKKFLVHDVLGRQVESLILPRSENGEIIFDAQGLQSGVYFFTVIADGVHASRKMVVRR